MNRVFLVYDIANDKARAKIANACQDYGLDRVQFSAFTGLLNRNRQEELMMCIGDILGDNSGNIKLIPISGSDWKKTLEVNHD